MHDLSRLRPVSARQLPRLGVILIALALVIPATTRQAIPQEEPSGEPPLDVDWVMGPADGPLGDLATIPVPEGYVFAGADDTRKIMEASQNLVSGAELGFVSPAEESWFVVFEFEDIGYVKDDEGAALDADAILKSLRDGNERSNEARKEKGWPTMEIAGWVQPPHYDPTTNNLEWAMRLTTSAGGNSVNYNTRLLGRTGVMNVTLVVDPDKLDATLPDFRTLISGHSFSTGQRYAEFKVGDKVAQYGLTALITGGAVAAAIKTGLFKKFWKLIVLAGAGTVALARKLFTRSARESTTPAG